MSSYRLTRVLANSNICPALDVCEFNAWATLPCSYSPSARPDHTLISIFVLVPIEIPRNIVLNVRHEWDCLLCTLTFIFVSPNTVDCNIHSKLLAGHAILKIWIANVVHHCIHIYMASRDQHGYGLGLDDPCTHDYFSIFYESTVEFRLHQNIVLWTFPTFIQSFSNSDISYYSKLTASGNMGL